MGVSGPGKRLDINMFHTVQCRIYLGTTIKWFGVNPDTWSDTINQKPDTGKKWSKSDPKWAIFWRFFGKLKVFSIRYELYILQQVKGV